MRKLNDKKTEVIVIFAKEYKFHVVSWSEHTVTLNWSINER